MFHRIVYIILLVSLSFSVDLVKESYNFEYNDNQKTLNIENQLEYLDLPQKLNDIYEINSESLIELGILPFSTLYLVENNKNYSVQIDVTSSYMLENIIIDVDDNVLNPINQTNLYFLANFRATKLSTQRLVFLCAINFIF